MTIIFPKPKRSPIIGDPDHDYPLIGTHADLVIMDEVDDKPPVKKAKAPKANDKPAGTSDQK